MSYRRIAIGCLLGAYLFFVNAFILVTKYATFPPPDELKTPAAGSQLMPANPSDLGDACAGAVMTMLHYSERYQGICAASLEVHFAELRTVVGTQAAVSIVACMLLSIGGVLAFRRGFRGATQQSDGADREP